MSDDNVVEFPGAEFAAHDAADARMFDRHRVTLLSKVLEDAEETVASGNAIGLIAISFSGDGTMRLFSTHDRLFTDYVLRSASSRLLL